MSRVEDKLEQIKNEWEDEGFEIISCSKDRFEVRKQWIERINNTNSHTFAQVVIDEYLYIAGQFSNKYIQLLIKTLITLGMKV